MINMMQKNDEPRPDMDDLLHDYFQSEMPRNWPAFKAPRQKPTISLWARSANRMALAACVALLIGGYLMLGGSFTTQDTSGLKTIAPESATKEKRTKPVLTPIPQEDVLPTPIGPMPTNKSK
jgi:hypothetical protein